MSQDRTSRVTLITLIAAGAGLTGHCLAQAPASAQRWEVRYLVQGAGDAATAVNITIQARVAILPNPGGTVNLGVSRVGGDLNSFFLRASDPDVSLVGFHRMQRGLTGEVDALTLSPLLDSDGEGLSGHFSRFRSGFMPNVGFGDNDSAFNGALEVDAQGRAALTNVVGSRAFTYDGVPVGVATVNAGGALEGDFANIYRFTYIPAGGLPRDITFLSLGMTARYGFASFDNVLAAADAVAIPDQVFVVRVPGPGACFLGLLGAAALLRRRRRA